MGISVNYAKYFLPLLLAVFKKDYHHVTTHINTDQSRNIFMKLLKNEIDIAIHRKHRSALGILTALWSYLDI